jgi:hypothetical protein
VRDSCGISGTGETPQALGAEEAHRTPRGKRASWSGDQPSFKGLDSDQILENSLLLERDWIPVAFCSLKREGRIYNDATANDF